MEHRGCAGYEQGKTIVLLMALVSDVHTIVVDCYLARSINIVDPLEDTRMSSIISFTTRYASTVNVLTAQGQSPSIRARTC
jgi:hypothetical protein